MFSENIEHFLDGLAAGGSTNMEDDRDIRYHIRKLSRDVIVEHLEMAGYACHDHEYTEDLEEALAHAVENNEVAVVDII